jgi:nitric oxide reductase large subunit
MLTAIFRSAATWTGLGLASGLAYREFTRQRAYTGFTQLALAHTHALALGTTILLVVLGLTKVFALDADRRLRIFLWVYNAGLAITFAMLCFKGTLQVLDSPMATSKAIAGVSGLGHMTLTGAFILLLLVIGRALKRPESLPAV